MKDKILKQIEEEASRRFPKPKKDCNGEVYEDVHDRNRDLFIEAAKFGYNIKESVDEKKYSVDDLRVAFEAGEENYDFDVWYKQQTGLSASQNTVSNEGLPHLDEFMKVTAKDKPIRNRK